MVTIIGGGGAGLYFAWKYKEKHPKAEVTIIEEHKERGKPIQCTGILTKELETLIPKKDIETFTLNKITKTKVFSPNDSVTSTISTDYIICNVSFIKYLHNKAEKAGVKIMEGYRYVGNEENKIKIKNLDTKEEIIIEDNFLVGADGPSSLVAKNNNLYDLQNNSREFLTGVQARIQLNGFDKEQIDFYPFIGEYAWFTPESSTIARVGVAASKNAKKIFDEFIKKYPGKILEMQGGPIPLHKPRIKVVKRTKNLTVALLGDAALQIKNTTGGGIIPGLRAAKILAEHPDKYKKKLGKLNRELYIHYLINKAFRNYTAKDWDSLIIKAKKPSIQKILTNTNRDKALNMMLKFAMKPTMIVEGIKAGMKATKKITKRD